MVGTEARLWKREWVENEAIDIRELRDIERLPHYDNKIIATKEQFEDIAKLMCDRIKDPDPKPLNRIAYRTREVIHREQFFPFRSC